MNLIPLNGSSNLQEDTDKFLWYYHLIKNELFEMNNKARTLGAFEVYNVRIKIKLTNKELKFNLLILSVLKEDNLKMNLDIRVNMGYHGHQQNTLNADTKQKIHFIEY
jgi:hypothetical protein